MAGFERRREALAEEGAIVIAASVDPLDKTTEFASDKNYRFGYGMTKEDGDILDSWYQAEREFIQPSEFLIDPTGKVLYSSYSDGPVGRMDPNETYSLVQFLNEQKQK